MVRGHAVMIPRISAHLGSGFCFLKLQGSLLGLETRYIGGHANRPKCLNIIDAMLAVRNQRASGAKQSKSGGQTFFINLYNAMLELVSSSLGA